MDLAQKIREIAFNRKLGGNVNVGTAVAAYALLNENNEEVFGFRSLTLTNAQILALHSSPAVIIRPTEIVNYERMPTSFPKIIAASAVIDALAGAYDTGASLLLAYGSHSDVIIGESVKAGGNANFQSTGISTNVEKRMFSFLVGENVGEQDVYDNALVLTTSSGAPVGGAPANTLKVTVYYMIT